MPADIPADEEWINAEIDLSDADGRVAADVLRSAEHTLRGAPENRRYDVELTISERVVEDAE